jgi:hypothetical protein
MRRTAEDVAKTLGAAVRLGDGSWKCRCPAHRDDTASLGVKEKNGKLLVKCYAECEQSRVIDELKALDLWPRSESRDKASWEPICPVPAGVSPPKSFAHPSMGEPARRWEYRDSDGRLVGYVCRFEQVVDGKVKKTPMPMSWCQSDDGRKDWRWKSFAKPRPLYGLEKLAARPKDRVLILEGEKACDAAQARFPDYVCVSWAGGTKAVRFVDFKPLAGRDTSLWPDADAVGRTAMSQVGEILFVEGALRVSMVPVPEWVDERDKGWDVADELLEGMEPYRDMLDKASNYEPEGGDVVEQLNKRYAFVLMGGKSAVIRETKDPETGKTELAYLSPDAFSQYHANNRVPVGRNFVPAGKYWLTHEERRSYEGVTFSPGRALRNYYNLWRGFAYEPDPAGDWSMFRDHLLKNAAQGDEDHFNWILGWFAHIFQNPTRKSGTSLAFRGKQGTGKTIVGKIFGKLMPQHYTLVTDSRYLFGNFNSHLASTIILHSDESFWGGDHRNVGKLKAMVTSDTHHIENKRIDPVEIPNFMRLLITTNDDWVVPAASEERRFAVFDMGNENIQDNTYFVQMLRQMRDGGYTGLLHHLLTMDLSQIDVGKIPDTKALRDQKEASLGDVAKFWLYCLTEGDLIPEIHSGWQKSVLSRKLYESCLTYLENIGTRYRPTPSQFTRDLGRLVPEGGLKDIRSNISGRTCWSVEVPDLDEARRFFDEVHGAQFEWKREPALKPVEADGEIQF